LISLGLVLAAQITIIAAVPAWSFDPDENLTARAVVLMDAATGKIIYQKDADLRLPPASTTKVVTALVALESGRKLKESLPVSKDSTRVPASKLYLRPGQSLSIEELLYGIMLASANDASMVLAEGIGGSVERFAELMTKKAHEIGATNSNFTNPHGLTAPDHYSTARDMAVLFRYAMKSSTFREIVQTKFSSVSTTAVVRKKVVPRASQCATTTGCCGATRRHRRQDRLYVGSAKVLRRRRRAQWAHIDRSDPRRARPVGRHQALTGIWLRQLWAEAATSR
jgi:D-alanyl-D-alanine carboxypeptidase